MWKVKKVQRYRQYQGEKKKTNTDTVTTQREVFKTSSILSSI